MADEKDLDQAYETLRNSSSAMAAMIDKLSKDFSGLGLTEKELKKKVIDTAKGFDSASKRIKTSTETIALSINNLKKEFDAGQITAEELSDELGYLRTQVSKTTDATKKAELIKAKSELEWANARAQSEKIFKDSMGQLTGVAIAGAITAYTGAAKQALSGGSGLEVAAGFMTAGIDTANKATQAGAGALSSFGAATAGAGGKLGMLGVAASVTGAAVSFLGNQMSELAKAGIGFMLSQTTKLIAGFDSMSASGAIYAGGMMEMIGTANGAGLTLEQFSKAVGENRDKLSMMGLGIGEASKRMAGAMKSGGAEAQKQMFALGLSAEEQAGAYATVMQRMAGPTQKLNASNEQVAAATMRYVTDLKTLQSITGEDVKAKQDKIRQENDTLAFQQELAKMAPEKAAALQAAMDNMTEGQRKALRERMVYGAVISKDVAIGMATNDGIRKNHEMTYQAAMDGSLNAQKMQDIQSKTSGEIQKYALENVGLARGQSEAATAGAKENLAQMQYSGKFTAEALEAARKAAEDTKKNGGGGAADLKQINQDFAKEMEKIAATNLPAFSTAIQATISDVGKAVKELAGYSVQAGTSLGGMAANALGIIAPLLTAGASLLPMLMKAAPAAGALATGAAAATGASAVGGGLMSKLGKAGGMVSKVGGGVGGLVGGLALDYAGSKAEEAGMHKTAAGLGIGSSALTGASMGAMLGPMGALAGGALGAGYGLYKNWGKLTGSPSTPATDAKGALTPPDAQQTGASGGSAATPDSGYTSLTKDVGLYDKITELVDVNKTLVKVMQGAAVDFSTLKDTAQKHLRIVS
jgi:hypothetical protein